MPDLCLVVSSDRPQYTILGASEAYLLATMTTRQDIVGRSIRKPAA
jgi:hypothetical protein